MTKFKLNKNYNHKADLIGDAFHIDEKRQDFIMDKVIEYWNTLTEKSFMVSKILDFIEQQDWSLIEKLYATERFASVHEDDIIFGDYNLEMLEYILRAWKDKDKTINEEISRENLKHMFRLLMDYNLEHLIETLKDVDDLARKFEDGEHNENIEVEEPDMTPKDMEKIQENIQKPIIEKHIPSFASGNNVSFYQ